MDDETPFGAECRPPKTDVSSPKRRIASSCSGPDRVLDPRDVLARLGSASVLQSRNT
jgi:hypothetical protein